MTPEQAAEAERKTVWLTSTFDVFGVEHWHAREFAMMGHSIPIPLVKIDGKWELNSLTPSELTQLSREHANAIATLTRERDEALRDGNFQYKEKLGERAMRMVQEKCVEHLKEQLAAKDAEIARLRARLLTAAGDDLCRLTQEEIKAMGEGTVRIPPKEEFLASCERFHAQVAKESGVMQNCLTLAQLIAENEQLRSIVDKPPLTEAAKLKLIADRLG